MSRILSGTRYLVVIPVIGLAIAASVFFFLGGIGLIRQLIELNIAAISNLTQETHATDRGLVISSIFRFFSDEQIASVFWVSAGMFLLMSLAGLIIKRDLSSAGGILLMLLLGWIVAWFFSFLLNLSEVYWALTFIGFPFIAGLTAWDTQRLKQMGKQLDSYPAKRGMAVLGALTLYLDFKNCFLLTLCASHR